MSLSQRVAIVGEVVGVVTDGINIGDVVIPGRDRLRNQIFIIISDIDGSNSHLDSIIKVDSYDSGTGTDSNLIFIVVIIPMLVPIPAKIGIAVVSLIDIET